MYIMVKYYSLAIQWYAILVGKSIEEINTRSLHGHCKTAPNHRSLALSRYHVNITQSHLRIIKFRCLCETDFVVFSEKKKKEEKKTETF